MSGSSLHALDLMSPSISVAIACISPSKFFVGELFHRVESHCQNWTNILMLLGERSPGTERYLYILYVTGMIIEAGPSDFNVTCMRTIIILFVLNKKPFLF